MANFEFSKNVVSSARKNEASFKVFILKERRQNNLKNNVFPWESGFWISVLCYRAIVLSKQHIVHLCSASKYSAAQHIADVDRVSIVPTRCFLLSLTNTQLEHLPLQEKDQKPRQCPYSCHTLTAARASSRSVTVFKVCLVTG